MPIPRGVDRGVVSAPKPVAPKPKVTVAGGIPRGVDRGIVAKPKAVTAEPSRVAPAPAQSTPAPASPAPAQATSVTDSSAPVGEVGKIKADAEATLNAQLDAIAAQWNLTRAQLDAEEGEIGRQWQLQKAELIRQADIAQQQSYSDMVERGILRSGITLSEALQIEQAEERALAQGAMDETVSLADIANRRAALGPQEAAEVAAANAAHEASLRDLEIMRAASGQA